MMRNVQLAKEKKMTDRHIGYIVTLEEEIREDDAESTINALSHIKGVLNVSPVIANHEMWMAEAKGRHAILKDLVEFIKSKNMFNPE